MRVPWSRIYRAFPELDRFTDEECERYVRQVRVQGRTRGWPLLAGFAGAILWVVVVRYGAGLVRPGYNVIAEVFILGSIIGFVLAICLPLLITRDRLLIGSIRRRIDNARCTKCRQSLLGLPFLAPGPPEDNAAVRCPECGSVMVLAELGLKPADLLARAE